jgi:hypothetical protein
MVKSLMILLLFLYIFLFLLYWWRICGVLVAFIVYLLYLLLFFVAVAVASRSPSAL